jgi:hypothetical protein
MSSARGRCHGENPRKLDARGKSAGENNFSKRFLPAYASGINIDGVMTWEAVGTWVIAVGTWVALGLTWWLTKRQWDLFRQQAQADHKLKLEELKLTRNQIQAELYVKIGAWFDALRGQRRALAKQLLAHTIHDQIEEHVMDFFEDTGALVHRGYLDAELAWEVVGYYGRMWWNACKDYVEKERQRKHGDLTLFYRFQQLADRMAELDMRERNLTRAEVELSGDEVREFLEEEAGASG